MKVPTSWQCAEGPPLCQSLFHMSEGDLILDAVDAADPSFSFGPALRNAAEAEFKSREKGATFVEYAFADYPGA